MDRVYSYRLDAARRTMTPSDPPYAELKTGSGPRRLQPHNRAPNRKPHLPPLHVAAVEHEVEQASGFDDGVGPVALDQEIGRPIDMQVGKASICHARFSAAQR